MSRRPAFQFYPDNFLAGTNGMSRAAVGAYISMLCIAWGTGPIPNTPRALWKAMGLGPDDPPFDAIWPEVRPKWVMGPGGWTNPRLEQVRADQVRYLERQRVNGQHGGRPSGNPLKTHGFVLAKPRANPKITSSSSSSSSSSDAQDQDQRADARRAFTILEKLAHTVFDDRDQGTVLNVPSELAEELKTRAAKAQIPYDGRTVTKALASAHVQRTRRA
jgi:uncharacterized protein YdaU (DUF1376 family)